MYDFNSLLKVFCPISTYQLFFNLFFIPIHPIFYIQYIMSLEEHMTHIKLM